MAMPTLREDPESIRKKIRTMPTDPARIKRNDPGDPEKCPVWQFHLVYTDEKTQKWVNEGCRSAGIGCLECKQPFARYTVPSPIEVPNSRIFFG